MSSYDSNTLRSAVAALRSPWRGEFVAETTSTQDLAGGAAQSGAASCTVFVADYQRAGRGRQGRTWLARPGVALMLSVVFRETVPAEPPLRWTSLASVSLVDAIEEVAPEMKPAIKWPNDVMLNEKKVAGILAETGWNGTELIAIVGVGVNVNTPAGDLASIPGATSLAVEFGRPIDRGRLLTALIARLDWWLDRPLETLHDAWQARLWRRGQRLRLIDVDGEHEVVVLGAERDGGLRVRFADGAIRTTTTGELLP